MSSRLIYSLIAWFIGFSALLCQIALIRECSLLFAGNELFLGITLASWVGGTGLGASPWIERRFPAAGLTPPRLLGITAASFPVSIIVIRWMRPGLLSMNIATHFGALITACICFILPCAFFHGLAYAGLLKNQNFPERPILPGAVFAVEAAGSALAGLLYTFFLAHHWHGLNIALLLSLAGSLLALVAGRFAGQNTPKKYISFIALAVLSLVVFLFFAVPLKTWLNNRIYHKKLVFQADTELSHVALLRENELYSYLEQGVTVFSFPDPPSNEIVGILPWLLNPQIASVALFGDNPEILKLLVQNQHCRSVTLFVEDPTAYNRFLEHLPKRWQTLFTHPKVSVRFGDPRRQLKQSSYIFDALLLTTSPPTTLANNRFYTQECLQQFKRHMAPRGLLVLMLPYSANRLTNNEKQFFSSLLATLRSVFTYQRIYPSTRLLICSSPSLPLPGIHLQTLQENFAALQTDDLHYQPNQLPRLLNLARADELLALLTATPAKINTDQSPILSGLFSFLWISEFSTTYSMLIVLLVCFLCMLLLHYFFRKRKKLSQALLFMLGMSLMTIQLTAITAFQMVHGNLWQMIGILFAASMAGLAAGSWHGQHTSAQRLFQLGAGVVLGGGCLTGAYFIYAFPAFIATPLLLVFTGYAGGLLYATTVQKENRSFAAAAWSADLLGSCLGAIITGTLLIPLLGMYAGLLSAAGFSAAFIFFRAPLEPAAQNSGPGK